MKKFSYKSVMQIPKLEKIVINVGCGEARDNAKVLDAVVARSYAPSPARSPLSPRRKKSVANFKLREGMHVGAKVTLRADRMWEFLDQLFQHRAAPRPRLPRHQPQRLSTGAATMPWACASS